MLVEPSAMKWHAASALLIGIVLSGLSATTDAAPTRLLLETDADAAAGSELFVASFNSFADVLSGTVASGAFSAINVNSAFSGAGFTFDGNQYHLLLETDADAAAGSELFVASFNSFADVLSGTVASGAFSAINVNSAFSGVGFDFDGSQYHFFIETDADAAGGSELFVASYNSIADLLSATLASGSFSAINVNSAFSGAGVATEWRPPISIPEPATLPLISAGLAAIALGLRRRHAPPRG